MLQRFCELNGYQLISPRIKGVESLADKIETGKYQRWAEVDDLVAAAIVVPTASHEDAVLEFLGTHFVTKVTRGRRNVPMEPEQFRFDVTRWYGRLQSQELVEPRLPEHITFEVQIRTHFEHAWSVVTHDLTYKAEDVDWRRLRLAAQLKAMVEQIELMIANFETAAAGAVEGVWPRLQVVRSVQVMLQALIANDTSIEGIAPNAWSRACDSVVRLCESALGDVEGVLPLIEQFCEAVREGQFNPATSGSLVQAVYAYLSGQGHDLSGFPMVDSQELHVLYRVAPTTILLME